MNLSQFYRLLNPEGTTALAAATLLAPTESTLLACHQRLRKQFPGELALAAIETVMLRRKAADKFSRADAMFFTREGLEQSSGETISTYRSRRFASFGRVGDFCCGIGGDTIGLTGVTSVFAVDADPLRLAMAAHNVSVYARSERAEFRAGDLLAMPLPKLAAAFFDPDRRADGRRHLRIREYAPALDAVRARLPAGYPLGAKIAPGVPWSDLHAYDAETEFISVAGELKECVLWFGALRSVDRRATVLPSGETLFAEAPSTPAEPGPPRACLYDPDPAVIRSGLVADLGRVLDARPVDAEIAYLTGDRFVPTPFARAYAIDESMPFHARRLGERLRALNIGHVTVTKRGSAVDVNELIRKWRLTGAESRTVILTRVLGRPWAMIGRPLG